MVKRKHQTEDLNVGVVNVKIDATQEELLSLAHRTVGDGLFHTKPSADAVIEMAAEFRPLSEFKDATEEPST